MAIRFFKSYLLLAVCLGLYGCSAGHRNEDAASIRHHRSFTDADVLAAYLHEGSGAGVLVGAYRGGPEPGYPENAIATFENALRYGPVLIETDVRMSRDSVLFLLHDETLDRTTTGTGRASDHTYTELRTLSLEDNTGAATPYRIPSLEEALAQLGEHSVRAILGTFGELDRRARREGFQVYCPLIAAGVDVIATDAIPEAVRAVERC